MGPQLGKLQGHTDIAPFGAAALLTQKTHNNLKQLNNEQGKGTDDHILPLGI